MPEWAQQLITFALGALSASIPVLVKGWLDDRSAGKRHRTDLADARIERIRAATSDLTDALSGLVSAYDHVVRSAKEDGQAEGHSEFYPESREVDPAARQALDRAWAQYQTVTGVQVTGRQELEQVARTLDRMIETQVVQVFGGDGTYHEDAARLVDAHTALAKLRAAEDGVLTRAQQHLADVGAA